MITTSSQRVCYWCDGGGEDVTLRLGVASRRHDSPLCTMGQVSNESQRPTPRRQRTRRGPDARRRRTNARAGSRGARGSERFVAGENGTVPSQETSASRRPATDRATPTSGASGRRPARGGRFARWWGVWGEHVRRFAPVVLVNHAVTLAVAIAIAVIIGIGETFTAVPAMVGSFWMLANLAPVNLAGADLGVAPLLPAAMIVWAHSKRIRASCGSQITVRNIRVFGLLAILVPVVLTALAWLVLWDASKVFDIAPPNILVALVSTVVLNTAAFIIGLGPKIWRALMLRRGWSTWPVDAARLAGRFVRWMLLVGLAAVVVQLVLNIGAVGDAYGIAPDIGGKIGLTLLSLFYLPNMAVGGAAVLMGSEMHIGDASASLFAVTNANLPPLPVLAGMPNGDLPFGEVLLVIPAVVAVITVYRFIRGRAFVEAPVFTALGAGIVAAIAGLVLSWAAGGTLGYYGSTGALLWLTPLLFLCWMVVPALVVFIWLARAGQRVTESAHEEFEDAEDLDGSEDAEDLDDSEDAEDVEDVDFEETEGAGGTEEVEDAEDESDAAPDEEPVDKEEEAPEPETEEEPEPEAGESLENDDVPESPESTDETADATDPDEEADTDDTDGESTK